MPLVLKRYPIAYHATPKVACTSIKLALYELEYGKQFESRQDENGTLLHVHTWQGSPRFTPVCNPETYYKFAVVRDPIERFLSAFANRVVQYRELDGKHLNALQGELARLKPNPSLTEFISQLDLYRAASPPIRHHTESQIFFLGKDLSYYDRIFRFTELDQIPSALRDAVGAHISLPHEQRGNGPKISRDDLSKSETQQISKFYANDYLLLTNFFPAD